MSDVIDVPAPVRAFVEAINAADTEAFVQVFAPEGAVDDWGTRYTGHDGVRRWAGSDAIGAGARMTLLSATTEGDTTTVRFDWRSRVFNGESTGIFVSRDGRLVSFTIPPEH
ncbi:nuclear transport factor 2 family protein [Microbacterium sp. TNHR37B]|uniref:nuclear transport factor 2 family protein n=1 Tax=Microbacterium sp. TNHR37B TaxID=1775956 RepID=UPI0007B20AC6|nr:nuclear transport factor 2 family protein [Microbacterium sp. TNHR37B]KZE91610.1 hypothetical protein AVP41_01154 [Microbacterium sp. TNHR37B]